MYLSYPSSQEEVGRAGGKVPSQVVREVHKKVSHLPLAAMPSAHSQHLPHKMSSSSSSSLPLQNKGIFHNLPTFDPTIKNKTALVTGANGISGFHTLRVLLESPERWTKVWAASRRAPPPEMMELLPAEARSHVEHVACDFLSSPEEIAKQLRQKGVTADAVFFYSYAQPAPKEGDVAWSNAQELIDVNSKSCIR